MLRGRPGQPELGMCSTRTWRWAARQLVQPRGRGVGRAVVDEDQLDVLGGHGLAEQRADAVVDVGARVVDRDDHADLGHATGSVVPWPAAFTLTSWPPRSDSSSARPPSGGCCCPSSAPPCGRCARCCCARRGPTPRGGAEPGRKVFILLVSAWGMGGTIRAAINLAGYLADHHDVEIVSSYRRRQRALLPVRRGGEGDARSTTSARAPRRGTCARCAPLLRRCAACSTRRRTCRYHNHSLWTDVRSCASSGARRGIVIATRPGLNMLVARPGGARAGDGRASSR